MNAAPASHLDISIDLHAYLQRLIRAAFLGVAILCLLAAPRETRAELLVGLTVQNSLITFDSATPGAATSPLSITGLVGGDTLFGIDRRPQVGPNNGLLYAFGLNTGNGSARIYTLNETSGAATLISTLAADPADSVAPTPFTIVQGTEFGIDFNPVPDRLRVVSNTGQNLRINVDNGRVQLDVPLAYQAGDSNAGDSPVVTSVAYSNNFGGTTLTELRGVDIGQGPDVLARHADPNGGVLTTTLSTGLNSGPAAGYDISGLTGTPYFAFSLSNGSGSTLYTVSGGAFTPLGPIGGGVNLRGLAAPVGVPVTVPESGNSFLFLLLAIAGMSVFKLMKRTARA